jgi:hypothetical protein
MSCAETSGRLSILYVKNCGKLFIKMLELYRRAEHVKEELKD